MRNNLRQTYTDSTEAVYALQPAIWPEIGISTEAAPYLRTGGPAAMSLTRGGVDFSPAGTLTMDCYFNIFNLGKWRDLCGEQPPALRLNGQGRFQVIVWLALPHRSWQRVYTEAVQLNANTILPLDLSDFSGESGILFFEMTALTRGRLNDFSWVTRQAPRRTPELVLSVTTFQREEAVAATVRRFRSFRASSELRDHISMVVVDNGQTLDISSGEGVTLIPNENLGGAGGFARGMIAARDHGATHCVFMDDDASIHMGAISRAWMLLAYATDPRTTVAAAMMNADHRWQIWENGAVFNHGCRPRFHGFDMRNRDMVFHMEFATTAPVPAGFYGGWWFFAFPLAQTTHMPFPFFVRGDDVSFSLANDFRIVTLPGIASFQESFTDKASPLTWYLDLRSHLAHHLSLESPATSRKQIARMLTSFYLRTVLRFHYDTLSAVNLAVEDVLCGPHFFAENADMAQRRQDLKALTVTEVWQPVKPAPDPYHGRLSRRMRALLLVTLNGHLLPFANTFGSRLIVDAGSRDNHRAVYGARDITYLNAPHTKAYTVTRNRMRFARETFRFLRNGLKLTWNFRALQRDWQSAYPELTGIDFWQHKLRLRQTEAPQDAA